MRKLKLKKLDNSEISIEVPENILVKDMRKIVELKSGIPENLQRIIYKAKLLKDENRLNEYIKEDGETLHLIKKPMPSSEGAQAASGGQQATGGPQPASAGAGMPGGVPNLGAGLNLNSMLAGILGPQGAGGAGGGSDANISIQIGGSGGAMPNLSQLLGQLGGPGAAGGPGNSMPPVLQNMFRPPQAAPARPAQAAAGASSAPSQSAGAQSGANPAIQLPHQVLFRIGQQVDHMYGDALFPGPPMPQI